MNNLIRFDVREFAQEAIIAESVLTWINISADVVVDIPMDLTRQEIELQDNPINMQHLTEMQDATLFRIVQQPPRFLKQADEVVMSLTF